MPHISSYNAGIVLLKVFYITYPASSTFLTLSVLSAVLNLRIVLVCWFIVNIHDVPYSWCEYSPCAKCLKAATASLVIHLNFLLPSKSFKNKEGQTMGWMQKLSFWFVKTFLVPFCTHVRTNYNGKTESSKNRQNRMHRIHVHACKAYQCRSLP